MRRAPRGHRQKSRDALEIAISVSDAGTSARQADHGRDQEQHNRNEKDDLGDFDRGSGDTTKAKNACDQRDYQKRNNPTQHDTDLCFHFLFQSARLRSSRFDCRNNPGWERRFPAVPGAKPAQKTVIPGTNSAPAAHGIKPVKSAAKALYAPPSCYPAILL